MNTRRYTIQRFYSVTCSECREDIAEDYPDTRAEAQEQQQAHEDWHQRAEREQEALEWRG